MTERDKIVAFIRRKADEFGRAPIDNEAMRDTLTAVNAGMRRITMSLADVIERGDHMKRPEPTIPASEHKKKSNLRA